MKVTKLASLTLMFFGANHAGALIWDTFDVQDRFDPLVIEPTQRSLVETQTGNMGTGEMDFGYLGYATSLRCRVERRTTSLGDLGLGLLMQGFAVETGSGPAIVDMSLQYDGVGDEIGNLGWGRLLTNAGGQATLPDLGGFRLHLTNVTEGGGVFIVTLRRLGTIVAEQTLVPDFSGGGRLWLNAPFSTSDLIQSDSVTFTYRMTMTGGQGAGVAISRIETLVPEPSTWLAMVGGLGLIALRRRKIRECY